MKTFDNIKANKEFVENYIVSFDNPNVLGNDYKSTYKRKMDSLKLQINKSLNQLVYNQAMKQIDKSFPVLLNRNIKNCFMKIN